VTYLYNIITVKEYNIPYCVIHKYPANVHLRFKFLEGDWWRSYWSF